MTSQELTDGLSAVAQLKKLFQWANHAEALLVSVRDAQNKHDKLRAAVSELDQANVELQKEHERLEQSIYDAQQRERLAQDNERIALAAKEAAQASADAELDKANKAAKEVHDAFVEDLNKQLEEAQEKHDKELALLQKEIAEAIEKRGNILLDIEILTHKWSK